MAIPVVLGYLGTEGSPCCQASLFSNFTISGGHVSFSSAALVLLSSLVWDSQLCRTPSKHCLNTLFIIPHPEMPVSPSVLLLLLHGGAPVISSRWNLDSSVNPQDLRLDRDYWTTCGWWAQQIEGIVCCGLTAIVTLPLWAVLVGPMCASCVCHGLEPRCLLVAPCLLACSWYWMKRKLDTVLLHPLVRPSMQLVTSCAMYEM